MMSLYSSNCPFICVIFCSNSLIFFASCDPGLGVGCTLDALSSASSAEAPGLGSWCCCFPSRQTNLWQHDSCRSYGCVFLWLKTFLRHYAFSVVLMHEPYPNAPIDKVPAQVNVTQDNSQIILPKKIIEFMDMITSASRGTMKKPPVMPVKPYHFQSLVISRKWTAH